MKRILILSLFLILSKNIGECATNIMSPLPPLQPIGVGSSVQGEDSNITSLPDRFVGTQNGIADSASSLGLNSIEQSLFGRSFTSQVMSSRLSRIEKSLFSTTYPTSSDNQRIDNIISNFNQINKDSNISKNDLSRIESRVLRQNYPQNSIQRRIERLEQQMLGAAQSGDINTRYETLKSVSRNYVTNQSAYIPTQIPRTRWKGVGGNLGSNILGGLMGGTMTGFTPQINPFYSSGLDGVNGFNNYNRFNRYNSANLYPSGYNSNTGSGTSQGYYEGSQDYSTSTGAGVTILD